MRDRRARNLHYSTTNYIGYGPRRRQRFHSFDYVEALYNRNRRDTPIVGLIVAALIVAAWLLTR
jgi:hypothetical protein